jgi:hypothetical protein
MLEEAIQVDQDTPTGMPEESVFEGHTVTRSICGEELDSDLLVERTELPYQPEAKVVTQFFSVSNLEDLLNNLAFYASSRTSDYKIAKNTYNVEYTVLAEGKSAHA